MGQSEPASCNPPEHQARCMHMERKNFFVGLALVGKDIVFRFIIEYSSLRDFYRPLGNNNRSIFT
jgi:hypothetical protein